MRSRGVVHAGAWLVAFAGLAEIARADGTTRSVINGSPAQLAALGLPALTGANVRLAVIEANGVEADPANPPNGTLNAYGLPQLAGLAPDGNPFMPVAGQDVNGLVYRLSAVPGGMVFSSHATIVCSTIIDTTDGVAQQVRMQVDAGPTVGAELLNSQNMLYANPNRGAPLFQKNGDATILNMSLGRSNTIASGERPNGQGLDTRWCDWAALTQAGHPLQDKLLVIAGNEESGSNAANVKLGGVSIFDAFNGVTVAATAGNNSHTLATYNGMGGAFSVRTNNLTSDASPYTGRLNNARSGRYKTDISAPGGGDGNLLLAATRVGSADDNFNNTAPNNGINSDPNNGGTSYAAPHVAGSAALMTELGSLRGFSTDHKVLKANLLNGASKNVAHWNRANGTTGVGNNPWRPLGFLTGNDALTLKKQNTAATQTQSVFIGWDEDLGTGLLDVGRSLQNYNAGQQAPGNVNPVGWDLNSIAAVGNNNQYKFQSITGLTTHITATLTWDRFVQLFANAANGGGALPNQLWQANRNGNGADTFTTYGLNDLDLEIWDVTTNQKVYFSNSDMDNMEHVDWDVPVAMQPDTFALRVSYFETFGFAVPQSYGMAWWTVPTPGTGTILLIAGLVAARRRRG